MKVKIVITDYGENMVAARAEVRPMTPEDAPFEFAATSHHPVTDCKRWCAANGHTVECTVWK